MREIPVGVVAPAYVNVPLWVAHSLIPPGQPDPAAVAVDHSYLA